MAADLHFDDHLQFWCSYAAIDECRAGVVWLFRNFYRDASRVEIMKNVYNLL